MKMAVSTMWIRNNMLFSGDQYERQLTEAELKVQRSLQKLSIPDWYLNKRSNPPKILNVTPIESRPPSWKYYVSPKNSTLNSTSYNLSDTLPLVKEKPNQKTGSDATTTTNIASRQQKSPDVRRKIPPSKCSSKSPSKSASKPSPKSPSKSESKSSPKSPSKSSPKSPSKFSPKSSSKSSPKSSSKSSPKSSSKSSPKSPAKSVSKSPSKSSPKDQLFDTTIPVVKLSKNISKTFPKVSPSRKIQNINLVFPPGPKIELQKHNEDSTVAVDSKYKTIVLKRQPQVDAEKKLHNDSSKNDGTPRKSIRSMNDSIKMSEIVSTPIRTPNVKGNFKFRATSTPKFSPANLFSSTIIEETPKAKKVPSKSILEKSFIFENSSKSNSLSDSYADKSASVPRSRKLSQNLLEKASIFETSPQNENNFHCSKNTPPKLNKTQWFLERNIRSIDPILFEKDEVPSTSTKSSFSMVYDIVKKMEISKSPHTPERKSNIEPQNPITHQERSNVGKNALHLQEKKTSLEMESPCTRFLTSRRKSTDLENIVKSKQSTREKSMVKGIIETLAEKASQSTLPRQNESAGFNHNFVKHLVRALEKAKVSDVKNNTLILNSMTEEDSSSESEGKSCTTSASPKDTDSSSDSDRTSSSLKRGYDERFDYESVATLEMEQKTLQDDDSVYWIPVSKCKLPRTSSLLSIMSKLSANAQSPCISPIRSESEMETGWGTTLRKTNAISRKLFRIDETVVIDSGYSDRSDRSAISSGLSITDSTWSEDNQNDSASEIRSDKFKKSSSRRKSIIGHTFSVY